MKNSLGKNAIYKVILNVFNLLVPLFVGPYIAGLLSPEVYGVYNRVYAEFQVFFILGAFGIYNYGVREISKVRNDEKRFTELFTTLFVIGIISNIIVTIVYVIYFMSRSTGIDRYVYLVMIIQMISNVFYIEFVNEAVENYAFITKKTIIIRILYFIGIFALVRKPTDVIIYSVVVSMTVLLNNLASFFYLKRKFKFNFNNIQIKRHIFPLIVALALTNVELLYSQLDKVMLSPFVNDIAVTEYTIPTTLMGMLGSIPLSLITVCIPRLSHYIGCGDKKRYYETLQNTTRVFMAILIPMSFGVCVLSKEIMWLYSKDVYTYAFPILALAGLSRIVFGYQSIVANLIMYVNGLEKQLTVFLFGGGVVNLILNFLMVALNRFNAFTALATTVISTILFVIVVTVYSKKRLQMKCVLFTKEILGYLLVSGSFLIVAYIVNRLKLHYLVNIIIEVPVCILIYGIYIFVTKDPVLDNILGRWIKKKN